MHIIYLRLRMGHADQYNDIHISLIFTSMKTICYDFEDGFGVPP